jgi:hypothetical protein
VRARDEVAKVALKRLDGLHPQSSVRATTVDSAAGEENIYESSTNYTFRSAECDYKH